jgi:ParB/RepB/Spo0J family partition protein
MITDIPVSKIVPSQTNPRKHFAADALADLAASVKAHGILQPILVRPLRGGDWLVDQVTSHGRKKTRFYQVLDRGLTRGGRYTGPEPEQFATREEAEAHLPEFEIVSGERRWRASKEAGLSEIPAVVRDFTDKEALEVAVVENLQRADLQPMEEAEGYELLMAKHGYAADDIAAKVGKSKAYVYARMKLTALCPEARTALVEGRLTPSLALLVARIPAPDLQVQALERCIDCEGEPAAYRTAAAEIQRCFMLRLREAPFNTKDAKLVPEAGACAACPHRTGNQKELFADIESADVCTNPTCFEAKRKAHAAEVIAKAKAKGKTVIEGAYDECGRPQDRSLVDADDWAAGVGKSWRKSLGKQMPETVLAVDANGGVHELIRRADAVAVLKELGKLPAEAEEPKEDRKAQLREQKIQRLYEWKVTEAILARTVMQDLGTVKAEVWRFLAWNAYQYTDIAKHSEVAKRRGLARSQNEARPALEAWLGDESRTPADFVGIAVELLCCAHPWNEDRWTQLARLAGVDLLSIQKQAEEEVG